MNNVTSCFLIALLYLLFSFNGYAQTPDCIKLEPTDFRHQSAVEEIFSPALEGNLQGNPSTQKAKIYLPPAYDLYPGNSYPVLYLLHGYTQDYNTYSSGYHKLISRLNQLVCDRIMVPMIIVIPNGKTVYDGSFYTNSYVSGNWEDYIVQDVMTYIESNYRALNQRESRGLSGFSMGAYGTIKIAMKYPSLLNSIAFLSGVGLLDFEEVFINGKNKNYVITAAEHNEYRSSDHWLVHVAYACAVAFAPDSSYKPIMGRLPYSADGVLIDSIWQKWLKHDPTKMLSEYRDSLIKLNAIQIYLGDEDDDFPYTEAFHQLLTNEGIVHGYSVFHGGHDLVPVIPDAMAFFSRQLTGVVPNINTLSDYFLERSHSLVVKTDMNGQYILVPFIENPTLDTIQKYKLKTVVATPNEETEIPLNGYEFGKYQVYVIKDNSLVSNVPVEFCIVPDTSGPIISIEKENVYQYDSIAVSSSRDGYICLVKPPITGVNSFQWVSEIMKTSRLKESIEVRADDKTWLHTEDLSPGVYSIFAFDDYGVIAGPSNVEVLEFGVGVNATCPTEIILFPNPVNGMVTLQTNRPDVYELYITSIMGQQVYLGEMEGTKHQIDLSSFEKGVYLISFRSKDVKIVRRIVKL